MKRLFTLALIFLAASSFAQLGIQVGWNTTGYHFEQNGKSLKRGWLWGVNAGIMYRTPGKHFSLQPALLYTQKGARNNNSDAVYVADVLHFDNRLTYVELAVPIIYKAGLGVDNISFDIGAGPYVGKLVKAVSKKVDLEENNTKTDFKVGTAETDDFTPMDIGLQFYMGARINHFNMSLTYEKGLSNINPAKDESIRNGCFSLNLGVFF